MKRQRTGDDGDARSISFEDAMHLFQHNDSFNCDQLVALANEITRLYAIQASLSMQYFPADLWLQILPRTGKIYGQQKLAQQLSWRTVNKSWNYAISKLDFSAWFRYVDLQGFSPEKIYKLISSFQFSSVRISDNFKPRSSFGEHIDLSYFTNLKALDLPTGMGVLEEGESHLISQLTQLTKLCLRNTDVYDTDLGYLTNLQALTLETAPTVFTVSRLTNLKSIKITGDTPLRVDSFDQLTRLEHFETSHPWLHRSGPLPVSTCLFQYGKYTGGWDDDGQASGKGTFLYKDGSRYVGDWLNNEKHGKGLITYWNDILRTSELSSYEGDWVKACRQGKGIRRYSNGDLFEGEWTESFKTGHGIYRWKDGSQYEGMWTHDQITGTGKCTYPNGDTYQGGFLNGQRHGYGAYTDHKTGTKVSTHWSNNFCVDSPPETFPDPNWELETADSYSALGESSSSSED